MKIDTTEWQEFLVSDVFNCKTTNPLNINEAVKGNIPYISRSSDNNGCVNYYGNVEHIVKGNCITIGAEGKSAFYQNKDFIPGIKIYTLRNKKMNLYNGLFISTVLNTKCCLYSYGRARVLEKIKNEVIKLPCDFDGNPDFEYMEKFIKSLNHKSIKTSVNNKEIKLNTTDWVEFELGNLFNFVKGKRLTKSDMINGSINYLGAICENNGVRQHIDVEDNLLNEANCITINYNGSVGEAFYQHEPFWASDDVNVLYPKNWKLDKYIALFICTIIKLDKYKFSYGRKWTLEKMKRSIIKLPVKFNGEIDFEYMETFIKSLPYSDVI